MPLPAEGDLVGQMRTLRGKAPEGFAVGYSGDWGCGEALLQGADIWFSVIGGLLPVASMKLTTAAMAGDAAEVARINALFEPLWVLFQEFGSLRVVYAAMNILGLSQAQPHLPILPISEAAQERTKAALEQLASLEAG